MSQHYREKQAAGVFDADEKTREKGIDKLNREQAARIKEQQEANDTGAVEEGTVNPR